MCGEQMKRTLKDRCTLYFVNMGRRSKILRLPAIAGLALSMGFCLLIDYFKGGTKRFACTTFILLCFMVGNSFAYPVFQEESGFISGTVNERDVSAAAVSDIKLAEEASVEYDRVPVLDDEDVLEGYHDAELHNMEAADKYSLEEILQGHGDETESTTKTESTFQVKKEHMVFQSDDWRLVLINKQHPIPEDYVFTLGNIKTIKDNMQCDERIIEELLAMMQAAKEDGLNLAICSPYRDMNRQEILFNRKVKAYMEKGMSYMEAYRVSSQAVTVPGASEHQIGLAIDIVSDTYMTLDEGFADTEEGKWLAKHSCEYGFILRYPKGKEYITSIEFEPWHFRYVGKEAAAVIMQEGITLEEFWDKYL